jgi:hypothetical protein
VLLLVVGLLLVAQRGADSFDLDDISLDFLCKVQ